VAGCADATIVIESAVKGGSLITAEIAQSYSRPVFAFPGNVGRPYSEGCNQLVRNNGAALITCAADFVEAMGWEDDTLRRRVLHAGIERQLFPELTDEEQRIVDLLQLSNDLQASVISVNVNLTISQVTSVLFQLELKGVVKAMAGGMYHLLM
jgi:DNA processing protein